MDSVPAVILAMLFQVLHVPSIILLLVQIVHNLLMEFVLDVLLKHLWIRKEIAKGSVKTAEHTATLMVNV